MSLSPLARSRAASAFAFALFGAQSVFAAEPSGCDKFKWPIERERAALTATDRATLGSGADLAAVPASGFTLSLVAPGDAKLPSPPERAPKEGSLAGFARIAAPPKPGVYTVSLSTGGWIDLVQDGHLLKPIDFSGATDCDGIRKTVKYELAAQPFVLQISGTKEPAISIAILPAD